VSNLGRLQRCEAITAFRVDHRVIPSGTMLFRYYMYQYAPLIDQMQSFIEAGSSSLAQYLTATEWQQLDLSNSSVGLESNIIKMMVVLEAIFDHTRKKFAFHLPSRLDCVFVWSTLESAKKFRQQYNPDGVIHRCVIQGEAVELDGSLLPPGINLSNLSSDMLSVEFQKTQLRAEKYWKAQEPADLSELLVAGNAEVVRVETEE